MVITGRVRTPHRVNLQGTLRPIRTTRLRELNRWTTRACKVEGSVNLEGLTHELAVEFREGQRQAYREGKKARNDTYFGALSVVLFTPEDVGLIRGAPEKRRRFIDRAIFTEDQLISKTS